MDNPCKSDIYIYQALVLASGLRLFAATGMRPNRAYTPTAMLDMASKITGNIYKRGQYMKAAAEVKAWADKQREANQQAAKLKEAT